MYQTQQPKPKPNANDDYKGVKKESVVVIMTDKDGKQTKIKL